MVVKKHKEEPLIPLAGAVALGVAIGELVQIGRNLADTLNSTSGTKQILESAIENVKNDAAVTACVNVKKRLGALETVTDSFIAHINELTQAAMGVKPFGEVKNEGV